MVETLAADGPDQSFGEGVHLQCLDGREHGVDADRSRSSVVSPGRAPAATTARRTHLRSVSAVMPQFAAIELIAAHYEG